SDGRDGSPVCRQVVDIERTEARRHVVAGRGGPCLRGGMAWINQNSVCRGHSRTAVGCSAFAGHAVGSDRFAELLCGVAMPGNNVVEDATGGCGRTRGTPSTRLLGQGVEDRIRISLARRAAMSRRVLVYQSHDAGKGRSGGRGSADGMEGIKRSV